MSEWNEREEEQYRAYVKERLSEILTQVKMTNGRMTKAELAIAVLQWGYGLGAVLFLAALGLTMKALEMGR